MELTALSVPDAAEEFALVSLDTVLESDDVELVSEVSLVSLDVSSLETSELVTVAVPEF